MEKSYKKVVGRCWHCWAPIWNISAWWNFQGGGCAPFEFIHGRCYEILMARGSRRILISNEELVQKAVELRLSNDPKWDQLEALDKKMIQHIANMVAP